MTLSQDRLAEIIRVDHAGEYGAAAIYRGQRAILGNAAETGERLADMAAHEEEHLAYFSALISENQTRPSALLPLWAAGGFALGVVSALAGEKAAMACTLAVETVIDAHYDGQVRELETEKSPPIKELRRTITRFRNEEIAHARLAEEHGARQAQGFAVLDYAVQTITRTAIKIAEKI